MTRTWLVAGLGNPGARYDSTRHNIGQAVLDELAGRRAETFRTHKTNARIAQTHLTPGGDRLVLAKPNSYMNVSGAPIAALAKFFGIDPAHLLIVHDDLDLPFDTIRLKLGGGHGGHNGVRDVASALGTADMHRVRVGIGRPDGRQDPASWVLEPFSATERRELPNMIADAADAVELLIADGLLAAQQRYHAPRD